MRTGSGSNSFEPWQPSRASLVNAIELIRRAVYFEHLMIVGFDLGDGSLTPTMIHGDWPDGLLSAYDRDAWGTRDPMFAILKAKGAPLLPEEVLDGVKRNPDGAQFLSLLTEHGVPVPVVIPIFHLQAIVGAVTIARAKPFAPEEIHFFALVAPTLHREFAGDLRADLGGAKLTRREVECLRHASTGMTSEEIALVMPLAAATVTAQIRSAAAKLGAANRVSAIAEAIRRGIIE